MISKNQKKAILLLINLLSVNYTGWGPKEEAEYEFYIKMLSDLDFVLLTKVVENHIKFNKYAPTIAELREGVSKLLIEKTYGRLLTDNEAWNEVKYSISEYGRYDVDKALSSLSELVRQSIKSIGFIKLCNMDSAEAEKKFKSVYKEILTQSIKSASDRPLIENTAQVK